MRWLALCAADAIRVDVGVLDYARVDAHRSLVCVSAVVCDSALMFMDTSASNCAGATTLASDILRSFLNISDTC